MDAADGPETPSSPDSPASEPAVPTLEHRGPFDSRVTAVLAAVWLALLLIQAVFVAQRDPLESLRDPEAVITRGVLRQLALELALIETAEAATQPLLPESALEAAPELESEAPSDVTAEGLAREQTGGQADAALQEADGPGADSDDAPEEQESASAPMSLERSTERAAEALLDGARRLRARALVSERLPATDNARDPDGIEADLDAAQRLSLRAALLAGEIGLDLDALSRSEPDDEPALSDALESKPRNQALSDAVFLSLAEDIDAEAAKAALPHLEPLGADYASALAHARLERAAGDREAAEAWEKLRRDARAHAQAVMIDRIGAWLFPFSLIGFVAGAVLLLRGPSAWVLGRGAAPVRGIPTAMGLGAFFRYAIAFQALGSLLALAGNTSVAISVFVGSLPLLILLGSIRQSLGGFDIRPLIGLDLAPERTARLIPVALTAWTALLAALVIGTSVPSSNNSPVWASPFLERVIYSGNWALWDLRIGAVIGAAMFEELAFRGLLFAGLRRRFRFGQAALISSVLFAFAHGYEPGHQLAILWVGFVLAYTFERTRCLWPCVLAHAGYNLIQVEGLALFI